MPNKIQANATTAADKRNGAINADWSDVILPIESSFSWL